jgi:putative redox protein
MTPVTVSTQEGFRTEIAIGRHRVIADESIEAGGSDAGPDPMHLLRGALGSCIAITLLLYARRKNWPLEKVDVTIDIQRFNKDEYPSYQGDSSILHEIRENIQLHGDQLTDEQRLRLLEIATKCPVRRVLSNPSIFVDIEEFPINES